MNDEPNYIQGSYAAIAWSPDNSTLATAWVVEDQEFVPYLRISRLDGLVIPAIDMSKLLIGNLILFAQWDVSGSSLFLGGNQRLSRYWIDEQKLQTIIETPRHIISTFRYCPTHDVGIVAFLRGYNHREANFAPGYYLLNLSTPPTLNALNLATRYGELKVYDSHDQLIAWSSDGNYVAIGTRTFGVWTYPGWRLVYDQEAESPLRYLAWMGDDRLLVILENGTMFMIDLTMDVLSTTIRADGRISQLIERNGVHYLVTSSRNGVDFINLTYPDAIRSMNLPDKMRNFAVTSDGHHLAYVTHFQTYDEIKPPVIIDIDPAMYA